MRPKILPWAIFLGTLLVLSLGSSRYLQIADRALLPARLLLLTALSILMAREWWRSRNEASGNWQNPQRDAGDPFLQRMRQWYYGDSKPH
jgi:hypothetical protein